VGNPKPEMVLVLSRRSFSPPYAESRPLGRRVSTCRPLARRFGSRGRVELSLFGFGCHKVRQNIGWIDAPRHVNTRLFSKWMNGGSRPKGPQVLGWTLWHQVLLHFIVLSLAKVCAVHFLHNQGLWSRQRCLSIHDGPTTTLDQKRLRFLIIFKAPMLIA